MENMNQIYEKVADAMKNSKKIFLCSHCHHAEVCKIMEEPCERCQHFLNAGTYKTYGNIYTMFQPIFDWLNFHYPAGEVKFVVDNNSAKMYQEHGPFVASKQLTDFGLCDASLRNEHDADDVSETK